MSLSSAECSLATALGGTVERSNWTFSICSNSANTTGWSIEEPVNRKRPFCAFTLDRDLDPAKIVAGIGDVHELLRPTIEIRRGVTT
jgi:hypothetical protein